MDFQITSIYMLFTARIPSFYRKLHLSKPIDFTLPGIIPLNN